jgi:hypothetical protein
MSQTKKKNRKKIMNRRLLHFFTKISLVGVADNNPCNTQVLYHWVQTELHILSHNLHRSLYAFLVVRPHNDRVLRLYTYLLLPNITVVLTMLYLNIYLHEFEDKTSDILVLLRNEYTTVTLNTEKKIYYQDDSPGRI